MTANVITIVFEEEDDDFSLTNLRDEGGSYQEYDKEY